MSRRQARFERRQEKRNKNKEKLKQFDSFDRVCSLKYLYKSAKKASRGVSWKASVQRYMLSILFKIQRTKKDLYNGKDIRQGFIKFDLNERGKIRHIRSVHFPERVVQKSICENALSPILTNGIIFDNSASQKGKGTHFATKRLIKHLNHYIKNNGCNGYVLVIDFKSYFDNISHESVKNNFRKHFKDIKLIKLADDFVDAFGEKGLGLGSETSQINAIAHISPIDHYIKEIERIKYYGRYMDDNYIIDSSKERLKLLLNTLQKMYSYYGVTLNTKKTRIVSLKQGFEFLKTRFFITKTGKIIKKPCRDSITRERRKLKKQFKLLKHGKITMEEIDVSFISWRGSMIHRDARKTIYNMEILKRGLKNECITRNQNV